MHKDLVSKFYQIRNILAQSGVSQSYEQALQLLWIVLQSLYQKDRKSYINTALSNTEHRLGLINLDQQTNEKLYALVNEIDPISKNELQEIRLNFTDLISSLLAHYLENSTASGISKVSQDVIDLSVQLVTTRGPVLIQNIEPWEVAQYQLHGTIIPPKYSSLDLAEDVSEKLGMDFTILNSVGSAVEGEYDAFIAFPPFRVEGTKSLTSGIRRKTFLAEEAMVDGLTLTAPTGKVVILAELSFLFDTRAKEARTVLLEQDLLETIITLPAGMIHQTGVKSCLIILNKEKTASQQVRLVDAHGFRKQLNVRKFGLDTKELLEAIQSNQLIADTAITISVKDILQNEAALDPGRYFFHEQYEEAHYDEQLIPLGHIVDLPSRPGNGLDVERISLITPGSLKSSWRDGILTEVEISDLKKLIEHRGQSYSIAKGELIFLANTFGAQYVLKPTFGNFTSGVAYQNAVTALVIKDKNQVDVSYLLQELSSDFVNNQLRLLSNGAVIPRISQKDLLSIRVRIPSSTREQQERVIRTIEAQQAMSPLIDHLQKQLAQREQEIFEEFNIFKHNFGKPFRQFRNTIYLLEKYLNRKSANGESISMTEQISLTSTTLGECLELLNNNLDTAFQHLLSTEKVTDFSSTEQEFKEVDLKKFIFNKVAPLFQNDPEFEFDFVFAVGDYPFSDGLYNYVAKVNEGTLLNVFQNFIDNAKHHGLQKIQHKKMRLLVREFNSEYDKLGGSINTLIFSVQNNGTPLPPNFKIDNFIMKGFSFGPYAGTGLGGYSIHRTIEKHGGDLWLDDPDIGYTVSFSFDIPYELKDIEQ